MQYALLIYSNPGATEALSDDEQEAVHRDYMELRELPGMLGGAALHPVETATTVRVRTAPERRFLQRRIAES
jgi:hypothetical protein